MIVANRGRATRLPSARGRSARAITDSASCAQNALASRRTAHPLPSARESCNVRSPYRREARMLHRSSIGGLALLLTISGAAAFDDATYPDWKGEWSRIGSLAWDPAKPRGAGQQAPLTAEYKAILDASVADQARGGQGNYPGYRCLPYGMPGMMLPYRPMEFVITPDITYIMLEHMTQHRWIYTDGRGWPKKLTPAFN